MRSPAPKVDIFRIGLAFTPEFINDPHAIDKLFFKLESVLFRSDWVALGPVQMKATESMYFRDLIYVELITPYVTGEEWDRLHAADFRVI